MRINVYSQELILDQPAENTPVNKVIELETKVSNTGVAYSAVRIFLHSSERLHHPPQDDDRSAITFWLPRSAAKREALAAMFTEAARLVLTAPAEQGLD